MAEPTDTESLSEAAKINEDIKKIIDESKMSLDDFNEGLKEREKLETDHLRLLEQKQAFQSREKNLLTEINGEKQKIQQLEQEITRLQSKNTDDYRNQMAINSEIAAAKIKIRDIDSKIVSLEEEKTSNSSLQERIQNRLSKKSDEILKNSKKYTEELRKQIDDQKDMFDVMGKHAKKIPVIGNTLSKALDVRGNIQDVAGMIGDIGEMVGGKMGALLAEAGRQIAKIMKGISTLAIMTGFAVLGLAAKISDLAMEVNELSKELGRATGFGDKFNAELTRMARLGSMAGIEFKQAAEALKALTVGLSSFNPEAEQTNQYVGLTVARLERLGVSAASSVKSIDHMQRSMGMTSEQAADATAQLARMGKEIGITGTKMIEDFNAASSRLAIFGKQNIQVFKEMAAMAKATGIEINTLTSVAEQFDRFDTAADSVAQLNAVLGTQLSTLEMMQATDAEKIMMMRQEIQMSVGSLDSLDKHTQMYIAQAMGLNDVAEAQKLVNMSTAEYQGYLDRQEESVDIQREIAEATEQLVPIMQQLKLAMLQFFMAFSPVIEGFSEFLSFISPFIVMFGKAMFLLGQATMVILGVAAAFKILTMGVAAFMVVSKIGLIIAGISLLVYGLSEFYDILHKSGSPMLYQMPTVLASAFKVMGDAILTPISLVKGLAGSFSSLFDSLHPKETGMSFNVEALAKMDTTKVAKGFNDIKSALVELSTLQIDGFLAMTSDGTKSSFVMGSDGVLKSISEGRLTVDVQMPEMKIPDINVKVYIGDTELRNIIRQEAEPIVDKKFRRG